MMTKQSAWDTFIKKKTLDLKRNMIHVSAVEIKQVTGMEPRLMAKFDEYEDQPEIFRNNGLFILPVKNAEYILVKGTGFHHLEKIETLPVTHRSRLNFRLTSQTPGQSEMQYIDYAYNSGLIESFVGRGNLYLTIRGRKYSPQFSFQVGNSPRIETESVQVEIDAGFEGNHDILVLEGKISTPKTFNIRQLYYPYRFWRTLVSNKNIIPIFFTYSPLEKLYNFWEYRFSDENDFTSIKLVRSASFKIEEERFPMPKTGSFLRLTRGKMKWLIPQADDVDKILEFPFRVSEGKINANDISRYFSFSRRQSNYYREAAETLGLIMLKGRTYELTEVGHDYIQQGVQKRHELVARLMFELPIVHEILMEILVRPTKNITKSDIISIIDEYSQIRGATLSRRAHTLFAWFRWLEKSVGLFKVDRNTISLS